MNRRNFIVSFLLWMLSFIFGYRVANLGINNDDLDMSDKDGKAVSKKILDLSEELANIAVNVKRLGAKGNGINDDQPAIQKAIDIVSEKGGGKVLLPYGTYLIKEMLTIKSNVELVGNGSSSVIKADFGNRTGMRMIQNDYTMPLLNVVISKVKIDRSGKGTEHSILLCNADNLIINQVEFWADVNKLGGTLGISPFAEFKVPSKNVKVVNCKFTYGGNFGVQFGNVEDGLISNNTFIDCYREVIGVEPYGNNKGLAKNISITGNTITSGEVTPNGGHSGLVIITQNSGGFLDNIVFTGNTIREVITDKWKGSESPGIYVTGGGNVLIHGNTISNIGAEGIFVNERQDVVVMDPGYSDYTAPATEVSIKDNIILNCGQLKKSPSASQNEYAGIRIKNTKDSLIQGNLVKGDNHTYGILEEGTSERNAIINNNVKDNVKPIFSGNYGVKSTIYGNKESDEIDFITRGDIKLNGSINMSTRNNISSLVVNEKPITSTKTILCSLNSSLKQENENIGDYGGFFMITARGGNSTSSTRASYLLHIDMGKEAAVLNLINQLGLTEGDSGNHPSFSFSLDTKNNKLLVEPVGSTSGTFNFHIIAMGDISLI